MRPRALSGRGWPSLGTLLFCWLTASVSLAAPTEKTKTTELLTVYLTRLDGTTVFAKGKLSLITDEEGRAIRVSAKFSSDLIEDIHKLDATHDLANFVAAQRARFRSHDAGTVQVHDWNPKTGGRFVARLVQPSDKKAIDLTAHLSRTANGWRVVDPTTGKRVIGIIVRAAEAAKRVDGYELIVSR